jgi:hypothetical protein
MQASILIVAVVLCYNYNKGLIENGGKNNFGNPFTTCLYKPNGATCSTMNVMGKCKYHKCIV